MAEDQAPETTEVMEEMGIISNVRFGMKDSPWPSLTFSVNTLSGGAGVNMNPDAAVEMITAHNIADINDLEGKPCIIEWHGSTLVFKDLIEV